MAIALGGDREIAIPPFDCKAGAAQSKRAPQRRPGDALPPQGDAGYIAGSGKGWLPKPAFRRSAVGGKPQGLGQCGLHLVRCQGDGIGEIFSSLVGGAVHRD